MRIGSESILALNPPFVIDHNLSQQLGSSTPVFLLQNGFPGASFGSTNVDLTQLQIRAQDPNQRTGYVHQLSFGPQIELGRNTSLEVTYVGNFARKMNRLRDANQGRVTGYDASGAPIVAFPYANLNDNAAGQHAFLELATNDGQSDYHAMLVSLRHRFTKGMSYGISYTWSHNISDYVDNLTATAFPQNTYDYAAERGDSPFDVRHRFVGFITYELPVGKGKWLLNNDGVTARLIGGWQVNSIVTLQTGTAFEVNAPDQSATGGNHDSRADCIGNPFAGASTDPRMGFWINPAAFAVPAAGQFGNCGARSFHGPGLRNVDLSLFLKLLRLLNQCDSNFAPRHSTLSTTRISRIRRPTIRPAHCNRSVVSSTRFGDPREFQFALKFYF